MCARRPAEAYREATENYRRLMEAVDAHVERLSEQTRRRIEEEVARRRKAPGAADGRGSPPDRG